MGRTWDEAYYTTLGYNYIELAKHGDFTNFYWIKEPDNPIFSKYVYGIFSHFGDFKGYDKNHLPVFNYDLTYTRFASVLFTSFAIVFVALIAWEYFSPFAGIVSALLLSMNPTALAVSQVAGIDSPRLFFAAGLLYIALKFTDKPSKKKIYVLGTLLGFSLITRFSDIIFVPMIVSIFAIRYWFKKEKLKPLLKWGYLVWFLIGFLQFVVIWPQPWMHLDYMIKIERATRFEYSRPPWEWFFGYPLHVPVFYFVVHFLIRTPLLILILGCTGIIFAFKNRSWLGLVLLCWFFIPFLQSFYPYKQHGIRYLIEIYIPFYIFSAVILEQVVNKFSKKLRFKIISLLILFVYSLIILTKITPYYFDFFNSLVGGPKFVYENSLFEIGWWGEGGRAAGQYLIDHAKPGAKIGYLLNPFSALLQSSKLQYFKFNKNDRYDYVVENFYFYQKVAYNSLSATEDYIALKKNYKLVYTVYADGAELYHVYKVKN